MQVPRRFDSIEDYRFGFQGQEKDDEIKGEGNSLNYTFRMHDPRVGRFFAEDPLRASFPHNSPYAFSENRVIDGVELEGKEYKTIHYSIGFHPNGDIYIKEVNWVRIKQDWTEKINDIHYAKTLHVIEYNGETTLFEYSEPADYGDVIPSYKGLYASARYDYTDTESMATKVKDDLAFYENYGFIYPVGALLRVTERDGMAPDSREKTQDLTDLLGGLPALIYLRLGSIASSNGNNYFSKGMDAKLETRLKKDGFNKEKYTGTSTAKEYILKAKEGNYSVVINYGGGRHSHAKGKKVSDIPLYYKLSGPGMIKTKIIDPTRYPRKEWIKEKNWRIIDGNTGKILKEKGVILKQ
jgi:RHS repeat-associated protein